MPQEDPAANQGVIPQTQADPSDPLMLKLHPDPMVNRVGKPLSMVWADPRHIPMDAFTHEKDSKEFLPLVDPNTEFPPEAYMTPEELALLESKDEP